MNEFITVNNDSTINLIKTCATAGLGGNPYRSGTYDYYVSQTSISTNDGKATGPFIMASLEIEKAGLIIPPLNLSLNPSGPGKVVITWKDRSYNAASFIIERKKESENNFEKIADVSKGIVSYIDSALDGASTYYYRAKAVSDSVESDYSNIDSINTNPASVDENSSNELDFNLYQNYPNPFNPETNIIFRLNKEGKTKLSIFDILGSKVADLIDDYEESGLHIVRFNASNLSSGIYFYKLSSNNLIITRKMILLK